MDFDFHQLTIKNAALIAEMKKLCSTLDIPKGSEILRENQYVKVLPIVIKGLIKVYSRFDEKELLLYYIEPAQSCIMSFYAALRNTPSKVYAIAEEDTTLLLIPTSSLPVWVRTYPDINELFFNQYNLRYTELLDTIGHILLDKMDKRLYDHILKKSKVTGFDFVKRSHQQLANELGTSREVITRMLKKLESEGRIEQSEKGIKIITEL